MNQAQCIQNHIAEQYAIFPEYLWRQFPSYAVFRHAKPKGKWFALLGRISLSKLGLKGDGETYFLNLKCPPEMVNILQQDKDIAPAYHMNKTHWLTIVLDRDFIDDEIYKLLAFSYELTA